MSLHDENQGAGRTLKVLLYSDDRSTRDEVRLALGRRIAADLPEVEIFDTATAPAAATAAKSGNYDVLILDGEASPLGGMGLGRVEAAIIFEELSRGDVSTAAFISIHSMAPVKNDSTRYSAACTGFFAVTTRSADNTRIAANR